VTNGQRIYAGVTLEGPPWRNRGRMPVGVRASIEGELAPVELELDEVCDFALHLQNAFMLERCGVAKAQRDEARAIAAARAAKADAGTPPSLDAGGAP
jgi:hypothetical protein